MKRALLTVVLIALFSGVAFGYSDSYIWNSAFDNTGSVILLYAVPGYTPGPHGGTGYSTNYIWNQAFDATQKVIRVGIVGGGAGSDTTLRGRLVGDVAPLSGQVLGWNGSAWVPVYGVAADSAGYAYTSGIADTARFADTAGFARQSDTMWLWFNSTGDTAFYIGRDDFIYAPFAKFDSAQIGNSTLKIDRFGNIAWSEYGRFTAPGVVTPSFRFYADDNVGSNDILRVDQKGGLSYPSFHLRGSGELFIDQGQLRLTKTVLDNYSMIYSPDGVASEAAGLANEPKDFQIMFKPKLQPLDTAVAVDAFRNWWFDQNTRFWGEAKDGTKFLAITLADTGIKDNLWISSYGQVVIGDTAKKNIYFLVGPVAITSRIFHEFDDSVRFGGQAHWKGNGDADSFYVRSPGSGLWEIRSDTSLAVRLNGQLSVQDEVDGFTYISIRDSNADYYAPKYIALLNDFGTVYLEDRTCYLSADEINASVYMDNKFSITNAASNDSLWFKVFDDSVIVDANKPMRIGGDKVHIPWLTVDSSLAVSVSRADTLGTSLWTSATDSTLYQYVVIDTTVFANDRGRWNWQLLDEYGYAQVARQIGNAAGRILANAEGPASTTLPWRASLYVSSTGNDESENSAIVFRLAQLYTYWHPYPFGHPYYPGRWEWRRRGSDSLVVMDSSGFNVNYLAYFNSDVYGGQFYSRYGDFFSGDPETWTGISMGSYDNSDAWVYAYYTDKLTLGADFGKYIRMVADSGVLIGDSWGLDSLWLKVNNDSAIIDANKPMRIGHNSLKIGTDGVVSFDDLSSKGGSWTWRSAYTDSLLMSLDTLQFGFPGSYPVLRMYYYTPDWALADSVVLAPNGLSYFTSLNVGGFSSSTISAVDFVDAPVIGREFHNGRDTMRFQAKEQMFTAWRTIGDDIPVVEKGHHTFYVGPTDSVFRTSEHGVDYWKWLNLQKNLSGIRFVDESNNDFGGMWVNSSGEPEIWGPRPSYDGTMSFAYLDRIRLTSSLGDSIFFELTADSAIIDANKPIRIGHSEVNAHVSLASIAISAPKLTTAGRLALSPAEGDLVYDLTLHRYFYWNGSDWTEF